MWLDLLSEACCASDVLLSLEAVCEELVFRAIAELRWEYVLSALFTLEDEERFAALLLLLLLACCAAFALAEFVAESADRALFDAEPLFALL